MIQTISKSKLKANMLQLFQEIEASGNELVVTDRNRPVLRIVPIKQALTVDDVFSAWRAKASYDKEDLEASTIDEWGEL